MGEDVLPTMTARASLMRGHGMGTPSNCIRPLGGQGPAAKAFLQEVTRRATADLTGWPKIQRTVEGLSLAPARGVAAQLALRCTVAEDR